MDTHTSVGTELPAALPEAAHSDAARPEAGRREGVRPETRSEAAHPAPANLDGGRGHLDERSLWGSHGLTKKHKPIPTVVAATTCPDVQDWFRQLTHPWISLFFMEDLWMINGRLWRIYDIYGGFIEGYPMPSIDFPCALRTLRAAFRAGSQSARLGVQPGWRAVSLAGALGESWEAVTLLYVSSILYMYTA